jgi:hypothetical protein
MISVAGGRDRSNGVHLETSFLPAIQIYGRDLPSKNFLNGPNERILYHLSRVHQGLVLLSIVSVHVNDDSFGN